MKVLVTGASGFVGRHLVRILLARGHDVTAIARDAQRACNMPWFDAVRFVSADTHATLTSEVLALLAQQDAVAHLAWSGLPNYRSLFHIEQNLPADLAFLKSVLDAGVSQLLVTGTCFEYGMQDGCLSEDMETRPANPYGLAKDSLRKCLQGMQQQRGFRLQWARLFYMFGEGQNPNSLLAQLDRAIDQEEAAFRMSGGEQLRDFLPVTEVAQRLVELLEHPAADGIFNVCSGAPVSVRRLVEQRIAERNSGIRPLLGHYPYPDYEPMAFWGNTNRFMSVRNHDAKQ